ncbi:ATP-binding cassette domain-containing protein [Thermosipho ferrireducens]|uniref:ATP-binding cassette domain-containing protein n=1 Tax=Thermosipho ferrireducens TaxID=2571116 RepID=A0ABX7S6Y8_9BACT|nr:ATP-binding cassette domain-containing protein [Thermosipho ferrireducens]QTA37540.1 ATP-binding cassette domain-containing protein [Thermosipho ferrireducens]
MFEKIEFINLSFEYEGRKILDNFNLQIKRGEKIAIVGSSGEGKTTLIRLMLRFISPHSGKILVNEKPISEFENWYKMLGVLSQKAHIFNRSLRENLLIANPRASDKEMYEALEKAGLKKFMQTRNLDTILGNEGGFTSGGERTRIALARLLLRKPEIVILDEPLEGVDKLVEKEVIENIRDFVKDKTLILISHRFSILSLTEEFAVLENGKIIEKGKYHEHSEDSLLKQFFKAEQELTEKFRKDDVV